MQYTLTINQQKALEWGLNAQQALLFAFVYECPSWAKPMTTPRGTFFALAKAKIIEELPLLTDKPDTAYRLLKQLEEAGVIELSHTAGNVDLVRLTDKGSAWNPYRRGFASPLQPSPPKARRRSAKKRIPSHLRQQVFARDGRACLRCGCSELSRLRADHVLPESKGGLATLENLQTLCMSCNTWKGVKEIDFRTCTGGCA